MMEWNLREIDGLRFWEAFTPEGEDDVSNSLDGPILPRLPPADVGLVLLTLRLRVLRERKGKKYCEEKLVGPMRDMARRPEVCIDAVSVPSRPMLEVLMQVRCALALHCVSCGACPRADEAP